jgi:hypothetical protein
MLSDKQVTVIQRRCCDLDDHLIILGLLVGEVDKVQWIVHLPRLPIHLPDCYGFGHVGTEKL